MTDRRKTELLGNFIGWFLDHQTSDEGLFRDLHVEIGMTKDELHDFSIDSLDELFDRAEKEHQKEIEETADTITAEDLVEQAVYAANAPDFLSEEEQAEDMLGMLGANIMDEGLQTMDSQSLIASAVADLVIKQSIEDQTEGRYTLTADTLHKLSNGKMMAPTVIEDLLLDRKEIELIEGNWETDELYIYLAPEYVRMEDESDLRVLSQEEVEAMCAGHVLWLNDAGGKQADFSNCVIRGMDLSLKNLMNANFNGAKLAEVNLYRTELNFSDCEGAKFYNCHAEGVYSEEVSFKDAVFRNSQLFGGTFTHSNFSNAQFNACDLCYASLQNCCLDGTDFGDSICDQMSRRGCSYDEEAWTAHALSPNLKIDKEDDDMIKDITELVNLLISNPHTIRMQTPLETEPSMELRILNNEIARMLDSTEIKRDDLRAKMLQSISQKYKEIDPAPYTARKLITELTEAEPLTAFNAELIGRTVNAVILNTDRSVSLILTNNQIIGKESYNGANYPSTESGQSYTAYG